MARDDSAEAAHRLLIEGFDELQLAASAHQLDTLLELAQLLGQWSKRINLTGHRTAPEIVRRLILDAAALTAKLPEIGSLADIGS
jgi:16S rRNA G527 N7-methylase RsmG